MSSIRVVILKYSAIDEALFNLMLEYGPEIDKKDTVDDLKRKSEETLNIFKQQIPEMMDTERSYPPFALYMVYEYIDRFNKAVSFSKSSEEEKMKLIEETLEFLKTLRDEIRESTEQEKRELFISGKTLIYKEKK